MKEKPGPNSSYANTWHRKIFARISRQPIDASISFRLQTQKPRRKRNISFGSLKLTSMAGIASMGMNTDSPCPSLTTLKFLRNGVIN